MKLDIKAEGSGNCSYFSFLTIVLSCFFFLCHSDSPFSLLDASIVCDNNLTEFCDSLTGHLLSTQPWLKDYLLVSMVLLNLTELKYINPRCTV